MAAPVAAQDARQGKLTGPPYICLVDLNGVPIRPGLPRAQHVAMAKARAAKANKAAAAAAEKPRRRRVTLADAWEITGDGPLARPPVPRGETAAAPASGREPSAPYVAYAMAGGPAATP